MSAPRLLVVGAEEHSLGDAVVLAALRGPFEFENVVAAGLNRDLIPYPHAYPVDVRSIAQLHELMTMVNPDIVVCTVGVNESAKVTDQDLPLRMQDAFHVNVIGVLETLRQFLRCEGSGAWNGSVRKKFVAVSSNSAARPRRFSAPYCASKAALSMALRVAARELAGSGVLVWGYEPGLLAGTPMTERVRHVFGDGTNAPLHAMPGIPAEGLDVHSLAAKIIADLASPSVALNGVMVRCDAGEV